MPVRWRVALAAIFAAAIVGGFLPHGVLSAAQDGATQIVQVVESPLTALPTPCADATCGKGGPAAPAPTPIVALAGVLSALAVAALAASRLRRQRAQVVPLPAGATDPLLRPPQFS
jgi:hypothetical protein